MGQALQVFGSWSRCDIPKASRCQVIRCESNVGGPLNIRFRLLGSMTADI